MKLKEVRRLTQQSVNEILGDVTELCTSIVTELGEQVSAELQSTNVCMEGLPRLKELFNHSSIYCRPFNGLDSTYLQFSFYKDHFGLIVCLFINTV